MVSRDADSRARLLNPYDTTAPDDPTHLGITLGAVLAGTAGLVVLTAGPASADRGYGEDVEYGTGPTSDPFTHAATPQPDLFGEGGSSTGSDVTFDVAAEPLPALPDTTFEPPADESTSTPAGEAAAAPTAAAPEPAPGVPPGAGVLPEPRPHVLVASADLAGLGIGTAPSPVGAAAPGASGGPAPGPAETQATSPPVTFGPTGWTVDDLLGPDHALPSGQGTFSPNPVLDERPVVVEQPPGPTFGTTPSPIPDLVPGATPPDEPAGPLAEPPAPAPDGESVKFGITPVSPEFAAAMRQHPSDDPVRHGVYVDRATPAPSSTDRVRVDSCLDDDPSGRVGGGRCAVLTPRTPIGGNPTGTSAADQPAEHAAHVSDVLPTTGGLVSAAGDPPDDSSSAPNPTGTGAPSRSGSAELGILASGDRSSGVGEPSSAPAEFRSGSVEDLADGLATGRYTFGKRIGHGFEANVYELDGPEEDLVFRMRKPIIVNRLDRPNMEGFDSADDFLERRIQDDAEDLGVLGEAGLASANPRVVRWRYPDTGAEERGIVMDHLHGTTFVVPEIMGDEWALYEQQPRPTPDVKYSPADPGPDLINEATLERLRSARATVVDYGIGWEEMQGVLTPSDVYFLDPGMALRVGYSDDPEWEAELVKDTLGKFDRYIADVERRLAAAGPEQVGAGAAQPSPDGGRVGQPGQGIAEPVPSSDERGADQRELSGEQTASDPAEGTGSSSGGVVVGGDLGRPVSREEAREAMFPGGDPRRVDPPASAQESLTPPPQERVDFDPNRRGAEVEIGGLTSQLTFPKTDQELLDALWPDGVPGLFTSPLGREDTASAGQALPGTGTAGGRTGPRPGSTRAGSNGEPQTLVRSQVVVGDNRPGTTPGRVDFFRAADGTVEAVVTSPRRDNADGTTTVWMPNLGTTLATNPAARGVTSVQRVVSAEFPAWTTNQTVTIRTGQQTQSLRGTGAGSEPGSVTYESVTANPALQNVTVRPTVTEVRNPDGSREITYTALVPQNRTLNATGAVERFQVAVGTPMRPVSRTVYLPTPITPQPDAPAPSPALADNTTRSPAPLPTPANRPAGSLGPPTPAPSAPAAKPSLTDRFRDWYRNQEAQGRETLRTTIRGSQAMDGTLGFGVTKYHVCFLDGGCGTYDPEGNRLGVEQGNPPQKVAGWQLFAPLEGGKGLIPAVPGAAPGSMPLRPVFVR